MGIEATIARPMVSSRSVRIASNGRRETASLSDTDLDGEGAGSRGCVTGWKPCRHESGLLNGTDGEAMAESVARSFANGRVVPAIGVYERV